MELTSFEADVLQHTARTGRYVTGDARVLAMAAAGLLYDHGAQRLAAGDHFLVMTASGREALSAWKEAQPKPPEPKKLTRSQLRYQEFREADSGLSFREWMGWRDRLPRYLQAH